MSEIVITPWSIIHLENEKKGGKAMRYVRHRHHKETYSLTSWRVCESADGPVLEGHLHKRPGYPEGIMIMTSTIESRTIQPEGILFKTANSSYFCRFLDHSLSSCPLLMDQPEGEHLTELVRKLRRNHYSDFIQANRIKEARVISICSCECSYIRWIAHIENEEVHTFDPGQEQFGSRFELSFSNDYSCNMRQLSDFYAAFRFEKPISSHLPVYVENAGNLPMTISIPDDPGSCTIKPGEIRQVDMKESRMLIAV